MLSDLLCGFHQMCCGRFVNIDTSKHSPSQQRITSSDCQIALATNSGMIYLMTNFQVFGQSRFTDIMFVYFVY